MKIFIDGSAGTTGLRIYDRLSSGRDAEIVSLSEEKRKDPDARRAAMNSSDVVFLCLPDDAAREAVTFIDNPDTVIIDSSTAHRTCSSWDYGFPELSPEFEERIRRSKRISVPGCHASGFVALVYPLIEKGIIPRNTNLFCHSLTGYSGGGKKMIAEYDSFDRDPLLDAPRQYGLTQNHKHLAEMVSVTGLKSAPVFCPVVSDFYSGMEVTVPLFRENICGSAEDIIKVYSEKYISPIMRYTDIGAKAGFVSAAAMSGKDSMHIGISGNSERILLIAQFDNLGKGASGAAIECLNLVSGLPADYGLNI